LKRLTLATLCLHVKKVCPFEARAIDALAVDLILLLYDEPTTRKTESGFARTSVVITHDKDLLYRLGPRIVMPDAGHIVFDGTYESFRQSNSPDIRPYFELMPKLQHGHVGN
jgi:ABC-type transporter Mla maintaining outer membrane lipid asymmetry ATPase subunit MlaF